MTLAPTSKVITLRIGWALWLALEAAAGLASTTPVALIRRFLGTCLGVPDEVLPAGKPGSKRPRRAPSRLVPPTMLEAETRTLVREVGTLVSDLAGRPEVPSDLLDRIRAVQTDLVALVLHRRGQS